ncbi:nanos homolog 2 [Rhinophrynus dorsalis]
MEFQPWKDYLQLALVVQQMAIEKGKDNSTQLFSMNHLHSPAIQTGALKDSDGAGNPNIPVVQPKASSVPVQVKAPGGMCNFCKHNGESRNVYNSHSLKNQQGMIACPVLRKYTCPLCGATGDISHTLKYCPLNPEKTSLYKKSGRNSAGRKVKR